MNFTGLPCGCIVCAFPAKMTKRRVRKSWASRISSSGGSVMTSLQSRMGRSVWAALVVILVMSPLTRAQDYRAKVQGIFTDASQAALPGAKVMLKNVDTGVEVTRKTNEEGRYIFDFVESGLYT